MAHIRDMRKAFSFVFHSVFVRLSARLPESTSYVLLVLCFVFLLSQFVFSLV